MVAIPGDVVAEWKIHLPDGVHTIEFEHGTTTGKRVVRVDDKEVLRKNWMFNLVGAENFRVSDKLATVTITSEGLSFVYSLEVAGKALKQFVETNNKQMRTWLPEVNGDKHRIVLDTKKMDIYLDGEKVDTVGEFVENGAENHFNIGGLPAYVKSFGYGEKRKGMLYKLVINNDTELDPVTEAAVN